MARPIKTARMELIEAKDTQQRDIGAIMADAYARRGSMRAAAAELGISVALFSTWVYRLGIRLEVEKAS